MFVRTVNASTHRELKTRDLLDNRPARVVTAKTFARIKFRITGAGKAGRITPAQLHDATAHMLRLVKHPEKWPPGVEILEHKIFVNQQYTIIVRRV